MGKNDVFLGSPCSRLLLTEDLRVPNKIDIGIAKVRFSRNFVKILYIVVNLKTLFISARFEFKYW